MTNPVAEVDFSQQVANAKKTVRTNVYVAMGFGVLPLPGLDLVTITGTQLNMLRLIAKEFDQPFSNEMGRSFIYSLLSGMATHTLGRGLVASMVKVIPFVGGIGSLVAMPAMAGATTHALGEIFIQHFASGGTLLDFDPEAVRDHFQAMVKDGEQVAADIQDQKKKG